MISHLDKVVKIGCVSSLDTISIILSQGGDVCKLKLMLMFLARSAIKSTSFSIVCKVISVM